MLCLAHINISRLLCASFLRSLFFLIYLQIASSAHLALLCSWVSESPPLQVRAKNEIAGHLIIKKFIKISQFHMIKICKKINKKKSKGHILQHMCSSKGDETIYIIIDCGSHYLPSKLVIWDLLTTIPL